jgi:hypothetical protein
VLEARVDHARVVGILRKADHLPLVKEYLLAVQKANLAAVNEAVNELLIEVGKRALPRMHPQNLWNMKCSPRLYGLAPRLLRLIGALLTADLALAEAASLPLLVSVVGLMSCMHAGLHPGDLVASRAGRCALQGTPTLGLHGSACESWEFLKGS